jgi:ATP-independent RNA helicase DbpA
MKGTNRTIEEISKQLGIEAINDMQKAVLNAAKNHKDIQVLSPTGTGKTLGFLFPLSQAIQIKHKAAQALIICPTRELVLQVESVFKKMQTPISITACYGGHPFSVERNNLSENPQIIVGTPGRLLDHFKRNTIDPDTIHHLILDEFDKSLEFGFHNEMKRIAARLRSLEKKYLISATELEELPAFVDIKKPHTVNFLKRNKVNQNLLVQKHMVETNKYEALFEVLSSLNNKSCIVFCNHRATIDNLVEFLSEKKMTFAAYHGKMEQEERELSITQLRNGSTNILIATDLAARGLDIPELDCIIHFHIPKYEKEFTHRNGRTARMHAQGMVVILLKETDEFSYLDNNIATFKLDQQAVSHPEWITMKLPLGKKDKINKIDIVGFMLKIVGLKKEELGLIEVKDRIAYAAVSAKKAKSVEQAAKGKRIKGKLAKFHIV